MCVYRFLIIDHVNSVIAFWQVIICYHILNSLLCCCWIFICFSVKILYEFQHTCAVCMWMYAWNHCCLRIFIFIDEIVAIFIAVAVIGFIIIIVIIFTHTLSMNCTHSQIISTKNEKTKLLFIWTQVSIWSFDFEWFIQRFGFFSCQKQLIYIQMYSNSMRCFFFSHILCGGNVLILKTSIIIYFRD